MSEVHDKESTAKIWAGIKTLVQFMNQPDRVLNFICELGSDLEKQVELNKQLAERLAACSEVLGQAAERGKVCECEQGETLPWPEEWQGPFVAVSNNCVRSFYSGGAIYCPTKNVSQFICELLTLAVERRVALEQKGGA